LACLCGSRSLLAAADLRAAASTFGGSVRVITLSQPFSGGYAPAAIHLEATETGLLSEAAKRAEIPFVDVPPAWQILHYSGSSAEYEAQLQWNSDADPVWSRRDFDPETLTFSPRNSRSGDRLSSFQDPITRRQIHRLWRSGQAATVDRDWGRWLYLKNIGHHPVMRFDGAAQTLSVPATVPLPALLGRALALCTGLAPARRPNLEGASLQVDVYGGVGLAAAELLATKLDMDVAGIEEEQPHA
jgi:hypothetical protein